MKIKVVWKNVFGSYLLYHVCDTAEKLAKLTRSKTFNDYHVAVIESLGYELEVIPFIPEKAY